MRPDKNLLRIAVQIAATMLLFGVAAVGVTACDSGSNEPPRGGTLTGARWVLASFVADGTESTVPEEVVSDALFAAGRMSGNSGVNQFSAAYTANDDGTIEIGEIASTQMAGPPAATAVEEAVLAGLRAAKTYYADGKTLTLYDDNDEALLVYDADNAGISGVEWLVTGFNNGKQAVQSTIAGTDLTASFDETGTVSGFAGVNTYNGPYTATGQSIKIGPLAATLMAGDAALMEQETLYLAALESAATYSLRGNILELRNADDAIAVTFTRK